MKDVKYINICPRCFSSNYTTINEAASFITGSSVLYECNKCGFSGTIFPQIDPKEALKMKKQGKQPIQKKREGFKKIKIEP